MQSTQTTATLNNFLMVGLILVTGGAWTYAMYGPSGDIPVDKSELMEEVEASLEDNKPEIQAATQQLAVDISEPVGEALYEQFQEDDSKYLNTVQVQSSEFAENVESLFIKAAQNQYRDYWKSHRQVLAEEFPEHADKGAVDELLAEFERVSDRLIERYYADEFMQEGKKTSEYWSNFDPINVPEDANVDLKNQLFEYVADWSVLAFTEESRDQLNIE